jgi:hypothetical protein
MASCSPALLLSALCLAVARAAPALSGRCFGPLVFKDITWHFVIWHAQPDTPASSEQKFSKNMRERQT